MIYMVASDYNIIDELEGTEGKRSGRLDEDEQVGLAEDGHQPLEQLD